MAYAVRGVPLTYFKTIVMGVSIGLAGAGALACNAGAPPAEGPGGGVSAVVGLDEVTPFFAAAAVERVDLLMIGDSNQLFGGHGWDDGIIRASHARFGLYATGQLSLGENKGNGGGAGVGYSVFSTRSQGTFDYDSAQPPLNQVYDPAIGMNPLNYVSVAEGETRVLKNHGVLVSTGGPIDVDGRLRLHLFYGVSVSGIGETIQPSIRRGSSPYTVLVDGPVLETTGLEALFADAVMELPAGERGYPLNMMLGRFNSTVEGPFVAYSMRVEQVEVDRGLSAGTLYGYGGQSLRDMDQAFADATETNLVEILRHAVALQEGSPKLMVRINSGLNDRVETLSPIVAPGLLASSAIAYEINLRCLIDRITAAWSAAGFDEEGLYFCLTPSHPVSLPDQALLVQYRDRAALVARETPRTAFVDLSVLTDAEEMLAEGWYQSNGWDRNHLTEEAYIELGARELTALQGGCSWFDANTDHVIDIEDLYEVTVAVPDPGKAAVPADLSAKGVEAAVRYQEESGG